STSRACGGSSSTSVTSQSIPTPRNTAALDFIASLSLGAVRSGSRPADGLCLGEDLEPLDAAAPADADEHSRFVVHHCRSSFTASEARGASVREGMKLLLPQRITEWTTSVR